MKCFNCSGFTRRGHFVLDKYARGKMRVERIGISTDVTGSTNLHSKANMDRQANEVNEQCYNSSAA